ncbi:hypothetical protein STEG23_019421 [Scotinomys teguina]
MLHSPEHSLLDAAPAAPSSSAPQPGALAVGCSTSSSVIICPTARSTRCWMQHQQLRHHLPHSPEHSLLDAAPAAPSSSAPQPGALAVGCSTSSSVIICCQT